MKIRCTTLFDITKTDISTRRQHLDDGFNRFEKERQQQSNFETLLQIIGLRSQPENVSRPSIVNTKRATWGSSLGGQKLKAWSFTFTVDAASIFKHSGDDLGYLKIDCSGVPMITGLDEGVENLSKTLESSGELKNITFEVVNDG